MLLFRDSAPGAISRRTNFPARKSTCQQRNTNSQPSAPFGAPQPRPEQNRKRWRPTLKSCQGSQLAPSRHNESRCRPSEGTRLQPIRKSKSHSFSKKDAPPSVSCSDTQATACLSRHWRAGPLKLFYGKRRAKFPKRCEKQKESVQAKAAHRGQ